jgi:hypothetical protein
MRALASVLATGVVALALAAQAGACGTGDPAWSPEGGTIAFVDGTTRVIDPCALPAAG